MRECTIVECNSTELIYSGVDSFMLGVPTETVCYNHVDNFKTEILEEKYRVAL